MTSGCLRQKGSTRCHLGNTQYWDRPASILYTGCLFLAFGRPVCADRISNCPLDRVLTYKNLNYLLNLQFCGINWFQTKALVCQGVCICVIKINLTIAYKLCY